MLRKNYLKTKNVLKGFLLSLLFCAPTFAQNPSYAIRAEGCYLLEEGGFGTFGDNFFVGTRFEYRLYEQPEWGFSLYAIPAVVYNPDRGLDVQIGMKINVLGLSGGEGYSILRGPAFPTYFLRDCGVYMRVNVVEGYGGW